LKTPTHTESRARTDPARTRRGLSGGVGSLANGREPHLLPEPWLRGYSGVPVHKIFTPRNHGAVSSGACAQTERSAIPKIAESSMSSAQGSYLIIDVVRAGGPEQARLRRRAGGPAAG